jgi:hypothetical protein
MGVGMGLALGAAFGFVAPAVWNLVSGLLTDPERLRALTR